MEIKSRNYQQNVTSELVKSPPALRSTFIINDTHLKLKTTSIKANYKSY